MSDHLIEQDDFANDPEIIAKRKRDQEEQERIDNAEKIVCDKLLVEYTEEEVSLEQFEMYRAIENPFTPIYYRPQEGALPIKVFLVPFRWTFRSPRNSDSGTDHYFFGWFTMSQKHPPAYIYKKSFGDRVADLFVKADTKLASNRQFSRVFRVLTNDRPTLQQLLDRKSLNELTTFPGLVIELNGYDCFFRVSDNPVDEDVAEDFVAVAKQLYNIFGK